MKNEHQVGVRLVYYGLVRSKKNNKRVIRNRKTGQLGIISSEAARVNEHDMIQQFKLQKPYYDIPSPLTIKIDMYEPNRTRRDLDNQTTSILDALTKSGIIEDDSINHVVEIHTRLAGIDKKAPRAIVHIKHKSEANAQ